MKRERFKKVVKYERYKWQEGELDFSHFLVMLAGVSGTGLFFSYHLGDIPLTVVFALGFSISAILCLVRKRKVYLERVK